MYRKYLLLLLIASLATPLLAQQPNVYPRPSQKAKVFQRIGTTDLEIEYHAPLANGRKVFGGLVVYNEKIHGEPHPWRAGANENTIIRLAHDVQVNGQDLKAGTYGIHIFVSENDWQLVFSNDYENWGSFSYKPDADALRVKLTPEKAPFQEWLSYRFINPKAEEVMVELHWANQRIQFNISTKVQANILADVMKMETKTSAALMAAANASLQLNPDDLNKAMQLTNQALALEANMNAQIFKVRLLEKQGKTTEANAIRARAIENAGPTELFSYAMSLNNEGKQEECLKILNLNLEKHPDHQFTYMGFGHYYRTLKDPRTVEYWKKAYEMAPESAKGFYYYQWGYAASQLDPPR